MTSGAARRNGVRAASAQDDGSGRVGVWRASTAGDVARNEALGRRLDLRQPSLAGWHDGQYVGYAKIIARLHVVTAVRPILAITHVAAVDSDKRHLRVHTGSIPGMDDRARRENSEYQYR